MIGTKTYMALSSTERPEATNPMTHEEFREFCVRFNPRYRDLSSGPAYEATRVLLVEACRRIAQLEGHVQGLRDVVAANNAGRQERIAVYAGNLTAPEVEELAANGVYPVEVTHG